MDGIFITDQEAGMEDRGYRGGRGYTVSQLSRPGLYRIVPQQQADISVTQGQPLEFYLPPEPAACISNFSSCPGYLEFSVIATRVGNVGATGFARIEPVRMITQSQVSINNLIVNAQDMYREITNYSEMIDLSPEAIQCQYGTCVDIDTSMPIVPAPSVTEITHSNFRFDQIIQGEVTVEPGGATGPYTTYTSSSTASMTRNQIVQLGVPRRYRLPLKCLGDVISDPDSLIPKSASYLIQLQLNAPARWACEILADPDNPALSTGTVHPLNIVLRNCELYLPVTYAQGYLRDNIRRLMEANSYIFQSILTKATSTVLNFDASQNALSAGSSTTPAQIFPDALKSIEVVLEPSGVKDNYTIPNKCQSLDNGIYNWFFLIGNVSQPVPLQLPVRCGYPNPQEGWEANNVDQQMVYENFRRSKLLQNREEFGLGGSFVNAFNLDGGAHVRATEDSSVWTMMPQRGYYPTALATVTGIPINGNTEQTLSAYRMPYSRCFKMCADLASVSNNDEFYGSSRGGQVQLTYTYNALRGTFFDTTGALQYAIQCNAYFIARTACVFRIGNNVMSKLDRPGL